MLFYPVKVGAASHESIQCRYFLSPCLYWSSSLLSLGDFLKVQA